MYEKILRFFGSAFLNLVKPETPARALSFTQQTEENTHQVCRSWAPASVDREDLQLKRGACTGVPEDDNWTAYFQIFLLFDTTYSANEEHHDWGRIWKIRRAVKACRAPRDVSFYLIKISSCGRYCNYFCLSFSCNRTNHQTVAFWLVNFLQEEMLFSFPIRRSVLTSWFKCCFYGNSWSRGTT